MKRAIWKAMRWSFITLCLCAVAPAGQAAEECSWSTCQECHDCCDYEYYSCADDAAEDYAECVSNGTPEETCESNRQWALSLCQETYDYCAMACENGPCEPLGGGGDPINDPLKPIRFGRLSANPLMCEPRGHRGGSSPQAQPETLTLDLRFRASDADAAGGYDHVLPKGYAHVGVAVAMDRRPEALMGARIKFSIDAARSAGGRRLYGEASSMITPSFSTGCFRIGGEVIRIEPVLSGKQAKDEISVRLILTR
jgi:hypothetical protein